MKTPTKAYCATYVRERSLLKVVSYAFMYWYMCRLDAISHRRLVVNKGCRWTPSTSLSSSWFLLLAYIIAPVVGINCTRRPARTRRSHTPHDSTFNSLAQREAEARVQFAQVRPGTGWLSRRHAPYLCGAIRR